MWMTIIEIILYIALTITVLYSVGFVIQDANTIGVSMTTSLLMLMLSGG